MIRLHEAQAPEFPKPVVKKNRRILALAIQFNPAPMHGIAPFLACLYQFGPNGEATTVMEFTPHDYF